MNTSILNLSTLFIILNIGFCSSCKDKDEPETICSPANTVLVPQDMKDRFYFKTGTYWIYKNLATQEIDSLWVIADVIENINVDDDGFIKNKCYESFQIAIRSLLFTQKGRYNNYQLDFFPQSGHNLSNESYTLYDHSPLNNNNTVFRIELKGKSYENQMGASIEFKDSIVTNDNITYKDVLHLYYPTGTSTYDYLREMYYAKNKGLVKFKRNTDNSEWELIQSKIIQ